MGDVEQLTAVEAPSGTRRTWRTLWPYLLVPPLLVAAGVAWLWFAGGGAFAETGRYTLS
jgi:hypothetical protein